MTADGFAPWLDFRFMRFAWLTQGTHVLAAGAHGERLWLLGGLVLALSGTGAVARAALRGRRDR